MYEKIKEILELLGPLIYVTVPAIYAIWLKVSDGINKEKDKKLKEDHEKAKEIYDRWEHEESQRVIKKIKDICNYYKDKGKADLVHYLQLENGTVATSKICNMFISCLAEDNRFGEVPKLITKLQRVPYSKMIYWMDAIANLKVTKEQLFKITNVSNADIHLDEFIDETAIKSYMFIPIYDPYEVLLGLGVFYYSDVDFNGQEQKEVQWLLKFKASLEQILLDYHMSREDKKKELNLIGGDGQ